MNQDEAASVYEVRIKADLRHRNVLLSEVVVVRNGPTAVIMVEW